MSDPISTTFDKAIEAIQKVGFPIVMCLILCAIIYYQNKTNDEMRGEMIKNGIEYNLRLTAQDKDAATIQQMIRDTCGRGDNAN